jgi:hypothetical protein
MKETLEGLEEQRRQLYRQLEESGDLRRGIISVNYRKCGKPNCACARKGHRGHGPQYLWNTTVGGKSRAANVRLGPELEKVQQEVENYRRFVLLTKELVEVNEKICQKRPVREMENEKELEALKKTLSRQFGKRSKTKSSVP